MEEILERLSQTSGVVGCLVAGLDGLVISSQMRQGKDVDLLGATVADLYRTVESTLARVEEGKAVLFSVERDRDKVFIQLVEGADTLLVVVTEPRVNLGLVRMEIQQAASRLRSGL